MPLAAPHLSIVVCFHNMREQAERTLYALTPKYQRGVRVPYEVIAIDNGSDEPLLPVQVKKFGANFDYRFRETESPSPVSAMNWGVSMARGEYVMCLIDGARMLSPGVLNYTLRAFEAWRDPFVYAMGMHLGTDIQTFSVAHNVYDEETEKAMLERIRWQEDGYLLFQHSVPAASSSDGFWQGANESNCIAMRRHTFLDMGGYDDRFQSPGGGLCNLEFFKRAQDKCEPVMLLGEATFHQVHGGVASNSRPQDSPLPGFHKEYEEIFGEPFASWWRQPHYIGHIPSEGRWVFCGSSA